MADGHAKEKGSESPRGPMAACSSHCSARVCDECLLVCIRSRPNQMWKFDYPVSRPFLFFLPTVDKFEKQGQQRGPHAVVL